MLPRTRAQMWVLNTLLSGVIAVLFAACTLLAPKFERPVLSVSNIEMRSGNFLQQNFLVKFKVQNPNDRPLPVRGIRAELRVRGASVATGLTDQAFVVAPFGEAEFEMNITANLGAALFKVFANGGTQAGLIDYEISGTATLESPFIHTLPFRQSGSISLNDLGNALK